MPFGIDTKAIQAALDDFRARLERIEQKVDALGRRLGGAIDEALDMKSALEARAAGPKAE
jgi:hypothetical protein